MNGILPARYVLTLAIFFSLVLPHRVSAQDGKLNIAPNASFENDLAGIDTNVCVFGGWYPMGVVTDDGGSEMEIVDDVTRTGRKSLRVTPNPGKLTGTIYYSQYNAGEEVRENRTGTGVSGARTIAMRLDQDILTCDASVCLGEEDGFPADYRQGDLVHSPQSHSIHQDRRTGGRRAG